MESDHDIVELQIRCPVCKKITAVPYARIEITQMLASTLPATLNSPCHPFAWQAADEYFEAMRALV